MPFDNPLRSLLDTLNSVTKVYNQKEQDQNAQAQMRKSTPSPMLGQQGPAMDQNNMAPAAALAAPWKPQQTPEYGALQQQIEAPQSPAMGPPAPGGVRDALGVPGMIQKGNIDLNQRPIVYNDDGSYSTVRSMGAKVGGRETLFPTVSDDGRIMGDREAIDTAGRTGRNLGVFKDAASSSAYGRSLHEDQAGQYEKQYREARPTVGPPNPYRGYESKQAFDARQGPNYSGDAVEGGQLSPLDFADPAARFVGKGVAKAGAAIERDIASRVLSRTAAKGGDWALGPEMAQIKVRDFDKIAKAGKEAANTPAAKKLRDEAMQDLERWRSARYVARTKEAGPVGEATAPAGKQTPAGDTMLLKAIKHLATHALQKAPVK